jgi:hypothetical protein
MDVKLLLFLGLEANQLQRCLSTNQKQGRIHQSAKVHTMDNLLKCNKITINTGQVVQRTDHGTGVKITKVIKTKKE